MALVIKKMVTGYYWIFEEMLDPRAKDDLLSSSVMYPALILAAYLYFVYKWGPNFMQDREPFKIRKILILYNSLQIILNFYFTFMCIHELFGDVNWDCALVDHSNSPLSMKHLRLTKFYMYLKILDLLDTVFFVLRKSYRQISFLHIYHHCGILVTSWIAVAFFPGGHGVWFGLLNGLVHCFMYSYYLTTALNEKYKKNIALKRSITQMQLVQFALIIVIYGRLLFKPECAYPKLISYLFVPQNVLMLCMFGDFYVKNYVHKKKSTTDNSKQK